MSRTKSSSLKRKKSSKLVESEVCSDSDTSSEHQRSSRLTPKPSYIRIIHLRSFILLKLKLSMSDSDTSENQTRPKSFDWVSYHP